MTGLFRASGTARLVLIWNAWLTAALGAMVFAPQDARPGLVVLFVVSWGVTGLVQMRALGYFGASLEAHFPEFARQIHCVRPFWGQPFLYRRLGNLALVRAVRRDPDIGVPARVYAVAYWHPLVLFVLLLPGCAYMAR